MRLTSIGGDAAVLAGGTGLLDLGVPVRFGGSGWLQIGSTSVSGGSSGSEYEMRTAYGGLVAELHLLRRSRGRLGLRTLFGVGNAKVTLPAVGTLIGADNFGVVEPEISGALRVRPGLAATAGVAYRFTYGVEDLPNVPPSDLRGPSLRVGISIGSL